MIKIEPTLDKTYPALDLILGALTLVFGIGGMALMWINAGASLV